ncbi:unnamed protein product [Pleuronectes platessa]|uniref:Uncharacterized protein n=1 Tax=Pleuronectes platessa TaxID=8262 RepID=A0A9N7ZB90_PLEPL|nr:unnamed protein product [Pleuronectes platessa]
MPKMLQAAESASARTLLALFRGCEEPRFIRVSCNREESEERSWFFSHCCELRAVVYKWRRGDNDTLLGQEDMQRQFQP